MYVSGDGYHRRPAIPYTCKCQAVRIDHLLAIKSHQSPAIIPQDAHTALIYEACDAKI